MADNMIKIYGALEAATEEGIVTYSESIYDRNRAKKLDEILGEVQTSVIPNPEIVGTPVDLIALKINNVIYKIKDVGAIILNGSSTTGQLTNEQLLELSKNVCIIKFNNNYFVDRVITNSGYKYTYITSSLANNIQTIQAVHAIIDTIEKTYTIVHETDTVYDTTYMDTALGGKQETLVSGTNIKTFNNQSILGSGNIDFTPATNTDIDNLFKIVYTITGTITHGSLDGVATILEDGTAYLTLIPSTGYGLPTTITVQGATNVYDNSTGVITLSNPTANVIITATCPASE